MQDSLRQQEAEQKLANDETSHNATVLETEGPKEWQELKTWMMETADRINRGFRKPVLA